ncbi:MAG: four helix bundle protein [Nitrospira sp.]|nr:four helix bundle protein [Nitrospira sp.]
MRAGQERTRVYSHKDLDVWKRSMDLASTVYRLSAQFPKEEVYGLSLQARRSAVSIPSNIAEGAARNSSKEFIQHLYIALGSAAELETQLLLARQMDFLTETDPLQQLDQIRKMLIGLIQSVKQKPVTRRSSHVTSL